MRKNHNLTVILCGALFTVIGAVFFITGIGVLFLEHAPFSISLIFSGLGALFLIIGLALLLYELKKMRKLRRLLKNGTSYEAMISNVSYNENVRVNGRCPLVVECTYIDRYGERYLVRSGNLYNLGSDIAEELQATVYVNPDNAKDYIVQVQHADIASGHLHDFR